MTDEANRLAAMMLEECIAELGDDEPFVIQRDDDGAWSVRKLSAYNALRATDDRIAKLEADNQRLREALKRCGKIVERCNWRQNEKVDDVPRIVRAVLKETGDE